MPSNGETGVPLGQAAAAGLPTGTVTIDGVSAADVVVPDEPQAVADVLADAAECGLAVAPVGGGTALALGNPPERLDLALSTTRLGGILDYEPSDLVLSVGAGARFGDVQAVLAEHGQRLPFQAPGSDDATIGGLISTALAGPRRLSSGTLRDLLIGISVAHPSGTITKAGGMVVKNVTGFDLTRVYHGALGTLGVVVSANFRVLPLPRSEATVVARFDDSAGAFGAAGGVRSSSLQPAAIEVMRADGGWMVAVLVEGRDGATLRLAENVRSTLVDGRGVDAEVLERDASASWWRRYLDAQSLAVGPNEALVRCAVRPRATSDLVCEQLAIEARNIFALASVQASPGLGLVVTRVVFPEEALPEALSTLQSDLLEVADNVTVLAAAAELKRGIDVWGRTPETLDVMRALKEQFDPNRVLNPGRFAGFI